MSLKIVLGSQSPRRKELLSSMLLDFTVLSPDIPEDVPDTIKMEDAAEYLAVLKSDHLLEKIGNEDLLITADTIVLFKNEIMGKPRNRDEAIRHLTHLSNHPHKVISGVCLQTKDKKMHFSVETIVYFNKLDSDEIENYIDQFKPFDKAGSYGIQEWIGWIGVKRIEGSYSNVMGLPTAELHEALKSFEYKKRE